MCGTPLKILVHEPPMVPEELVKPGASSANLKYKKLGFIWAGVIVASILVTSTIVMVAVGYVMQQNQNKTNENNTVKPQQLTGDQNNFDDLLEVTDMPSDENQHGLNITSRQDWLAAPAKGPIPHLRHPTRYVVMCHTAGRFCETSDKCSMIVRLIQENQLKKPNILDISYNFLVGGDGNIYEGRGWNYANDLLEDSVTIGLIGNYVYDSLTVEMSDAVKKLFEVGVVIGKLDPEYILVCHNQTMKTMSPGFRAYKAIKEWPHFTPELIS